MDVRITFTVDTDNGKQKVTLTDYDLEGLLEQKCKANGIEGRQGRLWRHLSPTIKAVEIGDLYTLRAEEVGGGE